MKANPDKFQAISVGKKSRGLNLTFQLRDTTINTESEVKLLGVTIDFQLNFDSHISDICKKAAKQLNVLKWIGHNLTRLSKITIYHSFILSNFGYCSLTWHFCSEKNTQKTEKLQKRALIYNDYKSTYDELLEKSLLPTLKLR
jgi:hypothetical protein